MDKSFSLTIVDNENLRGVLAPSKLLTKELLEDILDLIAFSRPKTVTKINRDFAVAKKEKLINGKELKKSLGL
jgi:hypothetical protein